MAYRLVIPDRVALTGCVLGLVSLIPGWLVLRPNRLASGNSLSVWNSFGWVDAVIVLSLWIICFLLSLSRNNRARVIALGVALNLIVILTFLFSGLSATRLLEGASSLSRVSLGAGVWITSLGAYVAIFSCRRQLSDSPLWKNLVSWTGLAVIVVLFATGSLDHISLMVEFKAQQSQFIRQLGNHIAIFTISVLIGTFIGIPFGLLAWRNRYAEKPVFFITNIMQTLPSLALFGLLIAPLSALSHAFPVLQQWGISGIGTAPAIIALTLYSLLPVTRNTYISLKQIDPAVINAGQGMGMTGSQVLVKIEAPLSAPLVLEGVRTASVQAVGNTAVAALIGAGGLGYFIFQGISQAASDVVLLGALPIMLLALIVDLIMRQIVRIVTPKGVQTK